MSQDRFKPRTMLTTLLANVGFLSTSEINDVVALLAARAFDGGE